MNEASDFLAAAEQVDERLAALEDTIKAEGRSRRRGMVLTAVGLALAGLIYTTTVFAVAVSIVNGASARRAVANCELINRGNEGDRALWADILRLAAEADRFFPPEQQAPRAAQRAEAKRLVDMAFAPEDCSTRRRT